MTTLESIEAKENYKTTNYNETINENHFNFQNSTVSKEHPLNSKWCFWYNSRHHIDHDPAVDFLDRLKNLGFITTIEEFFKYYCFMKRPSKLAREIDLHFFRENEIPMWESSIHGGCWIIKIKKNDNIDWMWESLLFACIGTRNSKFNIIGEQFENPIVIGVVLSLRPKERLIETWIKDGRNEKIRYDVFKKLKELLKLDTENITLYYKEHVKSMKDGSTMKNAEGFKFIKLSKNNNLIKRHSSNFDDKYQRKMKLKKKIIKMKIRLYYHSRTLFLYFH